MEMFIILAVIYVIFGIITCILGFKFAKEEIDACKRDDKKWLAFILTIIWLTGVFWPLTLVSFVGAMIGIKETHRSKKEARKILHQWGRQAGIEYHVSWNDYENKYKALTEAIKNISTDDLTRLSTLHDCQMFDLDNYGVTMIIFDELMIRGLIDE